MLQHKIARYGWLRDRPDHRDRRMAIAAPQPLADKVDLRDTGLLPPVYDQGQLGSCTANAIAAAVDFERKRQREQWLTPSRLFIYYNERAIEGTITSDCGAQIRDGIKVVASEGVCPESEWAYSDQDGRFAVKPTDQCYTDALKFKALQYTSVPQDEYSIMQALAILGRPVVFGISVFPGFESEDTAKSGVVPMPAPGEAPIGGHAIVLAGYDDASRMFLVRNSWGPGWGQQGYFQIPYAYVLDPGLASDFWVIEAEA